MDSRKICGIVLVLAIMETIFIWMLDACRVAMLVSTIHGGSGGGVLYEDDDLLTCFAKLVDKYAGYDGVEVMMPKTINEAVLVLDNDGMYYCYLFYSYGSEDRSYTLSNGDTMEYRDGWLITPDYQLYDLNVYGTRESVGGTEGRTAVGQFITFRWSRNQYAYSTDIDRMLRQEWPARLRIWLIQRGITYEMVSMASRISRVVSFLVLILAIINVVIQFRTIRLMRKERF